MRPVEISNQHPRLKLDRREISRLIHTLDAHHDDLATRASVLRNDAELSLVFLTDAALARLHDDFLDDPSVTDVITFEGNPALGTAGEICVSADTAARYAREHRTDFATELALYLVHGWLHLAGYDDLVPLKKRAMRRAEARSLAVLRKAGALPRFSWKR